MATQANTTTQPNVTERLWSLFDQVGVEALPFNFAQALAEGLNARAPALGSIASVRHG